MIQTQVKAIAIDLGGVLFTEGRGELLKKLPKEQQEIVSEALRSDQCNELRKGKITEDEFWRPLQLHFSSINWNEVKRAWYDSYVLDMQIVFLCSQLRSKGYSIIAFSGNIRSRINHLEEKYGFKRLFDKEVYSFDCGYNKPETKFFEQLLISTQLTPKEILVIDDASFVYRKAKSMGFECLLYTTGKIDKLILQLQEMKII